MLLFHENQKVRSAHSAQFASLETCSPRSIAPVELAVNNPLIVTGLDVVTTDGIKVADSARDAFPLEFGFWEAFRKLHRERGIDLDEVFLSWSAQQVERLPSPGARDDFLELCNDGCLFQVLAVIASLLRMSPRAGESWAKIAGQAPRRQKVSRDLEHAANLVDGLFLDVETEITQGPFNSLGRTPPSRVSAELRSYARLVSLAEKIKGETRTHSASEVAKYLLTSYTERMTRRPHDKDVAGLIAELIGKADYGEVDQRMWRARNYRRLDQHYSWITRIFVVASIVLVFSE